MATFVSDFFLKFGQFRVKMHFESKHHKNAKIGLFAKKQKLHVLDRELLPARGFSDPNLSLGTSGDSRGAMLGMWDLFEHYILAASKEKGLENTPFWPNFGGRTDRHSPPGCTRREAAKKKLLLRGASPHLNKIRPKMANLQKPSSLGPEGT